MIGTIVEHVYSKTLWIILGEHDDGYGYHVQAFNLDSHRTQIMSRTYVSNFTRPL